MTHRDRDIAAALRASLARRIGAGRYDLWFAGQTRLEVQPGELIVFAASSFLCEWLRSNFLCDLRVCCEETLGRRLDVRFELDAAIGDSGSSSTDEDNGESGQPAVIPLPKGPDAPGAAPAKRRRFSRLDEMVEGACNKLALTSARLLLERAAGIRSLLVHGPTAVGKTHLLEGLYSAARRSRRRVIYLSAEQFTSLFVSAVRGSGLPSFRQKYRQLDLLLIDDLQFFIGKKATVVELLHTLDNTLRDGGQMAFAADRPLGQLRALGSELLTRLEGGLTCPMQSPDKAVRLGMVRKLAEKLEIETPLSVREFVAANLTTHARELHGAMNLLKAMSLARECPITLAMAEDCLAEQIRDSTPAVRLKDIDRAVCQVFGLEAKTLQSPRKGKSINPARMLAMWLARKHTPAALSEIGQYFGRRSHSTVIAAQKKVNAWMSRGESLAGGEKPLTAEEAIRQVEEQLRAG